jgi:hypothetical protein
MSATRTVGRRIVDTLWPDGNRFGSAWGEQTRVGLAACIDELTAANDLLAALVGPMGDDWPTHLRPIEWLHTLIRACRDPKVFAVLSGDSPNATAEMLREAESIVTKGRAAIAKVECLARPSEIKEGRVAVILEGGLCQSIVSDDPSMIGKLFMVIDYDTDGSQSEITLVPNEDIGTTEEAICRLERVKEAAIDLGAVEYALSQQ